jgi:pilus assembly protein CpaE
MSEPLSLLIVDSDPMRRQALRELLKEHESVKVEAEAADSETGCHLVNQLKPTIVILDLGNPPDPGLAMVERLLVVSPHSAIFVTADGQRAETILRAVRAGAQEFLVRPVGKKELTGAIQRVARQRALAAAGPTTMGKLITLFGCKGGRGTTFIALNLAAALARECEGPVVAVDLDLQTGDLSLLFNLKPAYTIHDAVMNMDRVDGLFLKSLLCDHPSGVSLLAAPHRIEEADPIQPLRISQLLSLLKASCAYVVVDTPPTYDERTLAAMDVADELLLVAAPDFSSLYHTQRCLDLFDRLAYDPAKIKLLLNRCPSPLGKSAKMAQEVLKRPVSWEFPEDDAVMASAIAGEPLVRNGKHSPLAARFMALADQLGAKRGSEANQPQTSKGFRSLFRAKAFSILGGQAKED